MGFVQQSVEGIISTPPTINSPLTSTFPAMNQDVCAQVMTSNNFLTQRSHSTDSVMRFPLEF